MEGSYIDQVAKASKLQTLTKYDVENARMYNKPNYWVYNSITMCFVMLAQYGATGNHEYMIALETFPLFSCFNTLRSQKFNKQSDFNSYIKRLLSEAKTSYRSEYEFHLHESVYDWIKRKILQGESDLIANSDSANSDSANTAPVIVSGHGLML